MNQQNSKYWMNSNSPPRNNNQSLVNSNNSYMQPHLNSNASSGRNFPNTGYDSKLANDRANPK